MPELVFESVVLEPTELTVQRARQLLGVISELGEKADFRLILVEQTTNRRVEVGTEEARAFLSAIQHLAKGNPVGLVDLGEYVSTTRAAQMLGVSRPTLVGWLEQGLIEYRMVGTHRRVRAASLLAFQREQPQRTGVTRSISQRMDDVSELLADWEAAEQRADV